MFWRDRKRNAGGAPIPNAYWVQPGRLLAGDHPSAATPEQTLERLKALLDAGVTSFVDLTEDYEMPEYEALLPQFDVEVRYRRFPIIDHSIPESRAHMSRIIDAIDAELARGRVVYVHCRAGIGRTGTTIACFLIRTGLANEAALEHLQTLWRQSARSRRWPRAPETDEQVQFVREWVDATRGVAAADAASRIEGALLGLAIGELLAEAAEQGVRDEFDHAAELGPYAATTRLALLSLLERGAQDPGDQMERYQQWLRARGALGAPAELKRAVAAWQWSKKPLAGSHDPKNLDPHSLPRTLAAATFTHEAAPTTLELAVDVSRTTQQSPIVLDLCRLWSALFFEAFNGAAKEQLQSLQGAAFELLRARKLKPQVQALLLGRAPETPGADALSVTHYAREDFANTHAFRDAVLASAARRLPAASALCGALAGAYYGLEAIPLDWREQFSAGEEFSALARRAM